MIKKSIVSIMILLGAILPVIGQTRSAAPKGPVKATNIEFTDKSGKTIKLSDLYGKVLYIDVWATWCGPCRREIPYMEKIVEHYKNNKNVRFISISIDEDRDAWLKMIEKDKPEWSQYIATPEQARAMSQAYGIRSIPRFMIINADGTICEENAMRPSNPDFITAFDKILKQQKK